MLDLSLLDAEELLALGTVDLENDKADASLIKFKAAMQKDACPDFAHALIAKVYAQIKLFNKAEEHYQAFLQKHPDALNEKFQLGMVNLEKGDTTKALELWDDVLSMMPTHPPALFYGALAHLNNGKAEDAKRNLNVILQSAPADNLYFGRAKELLGNISNSNDTVTPITPNPAEVYKTRQ